MFYTQQIQRPKLAASEDLGQQQGKSGDRVEIGSKDGLRWLVSVNVNTCGAKNCDICRVHAAVLATGFLSGKSYWGPLQSRTLGTMVTPAVWPISVTPALLCS